MENCDRCVYSRFPRYKAPMMKGAFSLAVVGEAPGVMEIARKQLMMGPVANLLLEVMKKVGFDPSTTYFTDALLCAPPKGKPIKKEAIVSCRLRLIEELKEVQPRLILAMGGVALQTLTGDSTLKITQEQGTIVHCKELPGIDIIPVLHPAKILRSPGDYKIFHRVMQYAVSILNGGEKKDAGETQYELINTEIKLFAAIEILKTVKYIGADIEAINLNRIASTLCSKCGSIIHNGICATSKCKGYGVKATQKDVLVIGAAYARNKVFVFTPEVFHLMDKVYAHGEWIWHFGYNFDQLYCESRKLPFRMDHELVLLHYCLNESAERGLEILAAQYLGAKPYKSVANKYITSEGGFGTAPLEVQAQRVAMDADYTLQLFNLFYTQVQRSSALSLLYHGLLMPAVGLLGEMMKTGMLVNVPQMHFLRAKYEEEIEALIIKIRKEVGDAWDMEQYKKQTGAKSASFEFLPTSGQQLKWLVLTRLQIRPPLRKKTGAGEVSLDEEVILSLGQSKEEEVARFNLRRSFPFLADILDLRSTKKELGTYVEGALSRMDEDHRVHSTFTLHITSTGRLSSKDPNLQNIPSEKLDVRKGFKAKPGFILSENDYKGAELRVLAHLSGIGKLGEALIAGRDLHNDLGVKIWGDEFTRLISSKVPEEKSQGKKLRMQAKTVNFGIPYGREAYSIAIKFGVSPKEAQSWIDLWFEMYPEAREYLLSCEREVLSGVAMWTPYGRCRRFGLVNDDTKDHIFNEAKNFRVQSISSDNTLESAILIQPRIKQLGATIVNLVHDSILIEQPDNDSTAKQIAEIVRHEMVQTPIRRLESVIPFPIDIELGYTWGDLHDFTEVEE